jgi:hypothetical protein
VESAARLAQIVDSLVEVAVRSRPSQLDSLSARDGLEAVTVLVTAGTEDASSPGTPYAPAVDALIEVHRRGPSSLRPVVLQLILRVVGRARALAYLREVMTSRDETAIWAFRALVGESRHGNRQNADAALSLLRDVYERSQATDPRVIDDLRLLAVQLGWR